MTYRHKAEEEKKGITNLSADRLGRAKSIIRDVKASGRMNLVETEAREILKAYGLPISGFKLASNKEEAVKFAEEIGHPVAMKIVSPDIMHKSDAGGVKLNIKNKGDVIRAFTEITDSAKAYKKTADIYGVIITPMEEKGCEIIIGMTKDKTFGPTIIFGLGGIFVEVLKDVSFRVTPLAMTDAYEMIREIKGFPILQGIRGQEPADIDTIADMLIRASTLAIENPEISEMDLNPVFVFKNGASVVDARMILG